MLKLLSRFCIMFTVCSAFAMVACKKTSLTPEEQITGKWTMKTATGSYTVQGSNHQDITHFTSADYFDFKTDGSLQISETGKNYTGKWRIANNKLYITDTHYIDYANGFDVLVPNQTELQLHYTETSANTLSEQSLNLYKP
jgi:hypothetical protein